MHKKFALAFVAVAAVLAAAYEWISLVLVDTRIELQNEMSIWENRGQRAVRELCSFELADFGTDEPVEHLMLKRVFFVPDAGHLPYLDFSATGTSFEERMLVSFEFPGVDVPLIPSSA